MQPFSLLTEHLKNLPSQPDEWGEGGCLVSLVSGELDQHCWRAIQEDELGRQVLLQFHLATLTHQEDVQAELDDTVHVGEFLEHDRLRDAAEHHAHKLADDQDDGNVQTDDSVFGTTGILFL